MTCRVDRQGLPAVAATGAEYFPRETFAMDANQSLALQEVTEHCSMQGGGRHQQLTRGAANENPRSRSAG